MIVRRDFLKQAGFGLAGAALFPSLGKTASSVFQALEKSPAAQTLPAILTAGFPRAGYFRTTEWDAANIQKGMTYAQWEQKYATLDAIEGKVLAEEQVETERTSNEGLSKRDYFNRYKIRFPEKMVILHFNGNARLPTYKPGTIFDGHWLYYAPTHVRSDLPASGGQTKIQVDSTLPFTLTEGRYEQNGTDLCLVRLVPQHSQERVEQLVPDWNYTEQVTVTAIDAKLKTITVARARYGSTVRTFQKDYTLAFAHASEGPFGSKGGKPDLLWKYNYSLDAPKDPAGQTLAECLATELAALFAKNGKLEQFDGIEFDAVGTSPKPHGLYAHHEIPLAFAGAEVKAGTAPDGVTRYELGKQTFFDLLRQKARPGLVIMADLCQQGFGILNGVESEGFPRSKYYDFVLFSERMNKLRYWQQHSAAPAFSYILGKFEFDAGARDLGPAGKAPLSAVRLQIAASTLSNAAYFVFHKRNHDDENIPVWDELVMGKENKKYWLGQPKGDAVWLAESLPDVLAGGWRKHLTVEKGTIHEEGSGLLVRGDGDDIILVLRDIPYRDNALLLSTTLRAEHPPGNPATWVRLVSVSCGQEVKTWRKQELILEAYAGQQASTSRFYFSNNKHEILAPKNPCALTLTIEGSAPVHLENIAVRNAPNAIYREFEHGLVLANPSDRPYSYDLAVLLPGKKYRRLIASPDQDPAVNTGALVEMAVTVPARDALFLVRI